MPKIHVSKSLTINAPVDKVFKTINDFNTWTSWSPWLIMEPEAKATVADDAKFYEWKGDLTGEGNMKIINEVENKKLAIDLTFLKPWKSTAKVYFELEPDGDKTNVTWLMDSSLPFFMFWMKKMMIEGIGMDYDRGLRLLKDFVEDGQVNSKLNFIKENEFEGCQYVGLTTDCTKKTMAKKMAEDMPKLMTALGEDKSIVNGTPFTQYNKWELVKDEINYTVGIPVSKVPANLPTGFVTGAIPKTKVYTVEHIGPYHHLGNAWSTLYNMQRSKMFKVSKSINPFETYHNDPSTTDANALITKVHFPIH